MAGTSRFADRVAAGRALAAQIPPQPLGALVLGLANGGVPVAAEIARAHGLDLDAAVVRKVGHPLQPEYALGAVAEGGAVFPDDLDPGLAAPAAERARGLAHELRAGRPRAALHARAVLLVDDGLATGRSMAAALADVRSAGASSVTIAVPVAAAPAARALASEVSLVAVRVVESEDFGAVGLFYDDFGHVENDAVRALLDTDGEPGGVAPRLWCPAMPAPELLRRPEDLTTPWLEEVLGAPVRAFTIEAIGTGQMSESFRVTLDWEGEPASVVLKVAASDPTSRATGVGLGAYEREVRFYQEVASRLGGPLARCHLALFDPAEGWFTLLLEDVAPASQGEQLAGCSVEEAHLAMRELARLHAPVLGDVELGASPWLNQPSPLTQALVAQLLPGFFERYEDRITAEHRALVERFAQSIDGWAADRRAPLGLVHGDFRLDNLLFGDPGSPRPFTVVDWQTTGWGPALVDASYFLGGGLTIEDRRAHEEDLVRTYHDALLALGATGLDWATCWEEYRRQCFLGILMAVAASMLVERTERGDEMFMTLLGRHAQQAIDLDAVSLLPEPGAGRPPALRPSAGDEGRHAPSAEELWNESWYFDAVSADGSLGVYVRLGLYPSLGVSWYTAYVVGPGRPSIAIVDYAAPLPADGDGLGIATGALRADHICEQALERFRVTLDATGEAHDDASAVLRGESGEPAGVSLDLAWETAGDPYAYRMTTRYEIPCDVSGTIRIGGEEIAFAGPGQRDHSWGSRDWWSMDWVWSALRLDDGTRLHAVELRLPDMPRMGVGYAQAGGDLVELDSVKASEQVADNGLITAASLALDPGGIEAQIEPLAFGPLLLVAPDGRVSQFPRAMVRVRTADGRTGSGWVEWNRNVTG